MVKETITGPVYEPDNYCQVVPMTFEERYRMYMKCRKEELARMLAERDQLHMDSFPIQQPYNPFPSYPPACPSYPWNPIGPYYEYPHITCENNSATTIA